MIAGHPTSCLLWMVTHKQIYLFKERLLKCEPIDLGSFCCGPQGEALGWSDILFWSASTSAQQQTLHLLSMVRPAYQEPLVTHSPYTLPKYMLLNLPRDFIRSVARFRLWAHILRIDPSRPENLQERACGLAHKLASALAAGWLK